MARLKEYIPVIGALAGVLLALVTVLHFVVVVPMNARLDDLRSDMNQRFNQQDKYMNAGFDAVDQRFDQQDKYINARFDAVDQRFEAVDERFDAVDQRFDAVDQRIDAVDQRIDAVDQRLGRLEAGVSELRTLGERTSRNEGRIDLLTEQLQPIPTPGR